MITDVFSQTDRAVVVLSDEGISLSVLSNGEKCVFRGTNPLSRFPTLHALVSSYDKDPRSVTDSVLQVSRDLFSCVESTTKKIPLVVVGKTYYQKIFLSVGLEEELKTEYSAAEYLDFGFPISTVYVFPSLNEVVGGEVVCECVKLKEKSLLVDCEDTVTLYLIGERDDLCTAIWDCKYDEIGMRCIRAAAKYLYREEKFSAVYLYGKHLRVAEDALDEDFACIRKEKSIDSVLDAVTNQRIFSNVNKEIARTTYVRVYDKEVFQRYLTE